MAEPPPAAGSPLGGAHGDGRAGRQRVLLRFLVSVAALAALAAVAGVALPGAAGRVAGGGAVAVVIAAPLVRVAWLGLRWLRKGDLRFAAAALAVLATVAGGGAVSLLGA